MTELKPEDILNRIMFIKGEMDYYDDYDIYKEELEALKKQILDALEWYKRKNRIYEIKDDLQEIIKKRNLEIHHLKKKLRKLEGKAEKWDRLSDPTDEIYHDVWMGLSEYAQQIIKDKEKLKQENKELKGEIKIQKNKTATATTNYLKNKEIVEKIRDFVNDEDRIGDAKECYQFLRYKIFTEMSK